MPKCIDDPATAFFPMGNQSPNANDEVVDVLGELVAQSPRKTTLRQELRRLKRLLSEVSDIHLFNSSFRRIQLSRNNGHYDLLIKICNLIHFALLPHESGRGSKFSDVLENGVLMWDVFQAFVYNFLKVEQREFSVRSEYIQWDAVARTLKTRNTYL